MDDKKPAENAAPTGAAPDALEQEPIEGAQPSSNAEPAGGKPPKKQSGFKKLLKKFNLYFLLFIFVVVIAGAVAMVSYLNSKKAPKTPAIASQNLSTDALKQLSNSDATVGSSGQTLTVQGNAVFSGQVLIRSDLNVAGTIKVGTDMIVPSLTVSGKGNLGDTQINSLQVAQGSTFQGQVTFQNGINVAGAAAFNAPVTMSQLTVTKLILSGNASLQVPNHIAFTGASPSRTSADSSVLGSGGTASINGSDTTGTINANTGGGTGTGCFVTIKFNQVYTSAPHVIVSPVGAAAGQMQYYVNRDSSGFSVCTASAPPSGQAFAFDYFVTQ
jgi:cytoskeletal protein CcmA (bactofilin family)